jgi:MFS family permease
VKGSQRRILGVSSNVFFLGLVSLLTDISSDMIFTLLPLFLFSVLGTPVAVIGLIEGVGEATATSFRLVSGWLSDRMGRRKGLAAAGYGLSTVAKPFLYLAGSWGMVLGVRFTDRMGKAIRTAPRDALLADSAAPEEWGRSFGLHRSMDGLGAMVGLGLAALVVYLAQQGTVTLAGETFRSLVLMSIVPAALAVVILLLFVSDSAPRTGGPPTVGADTINPHFKLFLGIMVVFTLGRLADAFLVLRAHDLGLSTLNILLLFILFHLLFSGVSVVAGGLSDRVGRRVVLTLGWASFGLIYLGLAAAREPWQVAALIVLYGVSFGSTEGVGRALVADMVGMRRRGTAYGLYHGVVGFAALPGGLIAGYLWQAVNPSAPFLVAASLMGLATAALLALLREPAR